MSCNLRSAARLPKELGSEPESSGMLKSVKFLSDCRLPRDGGSVPQRSEPVRDMVVAAGRLTPTSAGIVPTQPVTRVHTVLFAVQVQGAVVVVVAAAAAATTRNQVRILGRNMMTTCTEDAHTRRPQRSSNTKKTVEGVIINISQSQYKNATHHRHTLITLQHTAMP